MSNTIGLKQRIKLAQTPEEIHALLDEGSGFKYASDHTIRQWRRIAKKRMAELEGGDKKEENKSKKKSKNKHRRKKNVSKNS